MLNYSLCPRPRSPRRPSTSTWASCTVARPWWRCTWSHCKGPLHRLLGEAVPGVLQPLVEFGQAPPMNAGRVSGQLVVGMCGTVNTQAFSNRNAARRCEPHHPANFTPGELCRCGMGLFAAQPRKTARAWSACCAML